MSESLRRLVAHLGRRDARHVRNAVARFDLVNGVNDADRDRAGRRIREAARRHGVQIHERGWRELMHQERGGRVSVRPDGGMRGTC